MTELFSETNVRLVLRTLLRLGIPKRDAEDLAQEVFLIVHKRAHEFDVEKAVAPWLYGIARNVARAHWRKAGVRREEIGRSQDVAEIEREGTGPGHDSVDLVRRAISLLKEPLLDVLMLRDFLGMTLAETSTELQIPFDTAKDRLSRARSEVRARLQSWEVEVG